MILRRIEKYLAGSGMSPTAFGRAVAGDPRLVHDMKRGRRLGPGLVARIDAFIGAAK